jgi:DNA polymerase-1
MLHVAEEFKRADLKAQLLMQVHDELLVETPATESEQVAQLLKREMETAVQLDVPLIVDVGIADNWMDAKP